MVRLIRGELLKLRTTQVWFWLLLAALGISALVAVGGLAPHDSVRTPAEIADIFGNAKGASMSCSSSASSASPPSSATRRSRRRC
jgi:ABC-2 type transport system permease protein